MHKRVHDADSSELRGNKLVIRGMRVKSDKLRCTGICDAVEFFRSEEGVELYGRKGKWLPRPVEYKRGAALLREISFSGNSITQDGAWKEQ